METKDSKRMNRRAFLKALGDGSARLAGASAIAGTVAALTDADRNTAKVPQQPPEKFPQTR